MSNNYYSIRANFLKIYYTIEMSSMTFQTNSYNSFFFLLYNCTCIATLRCRLKTEQRQQAYSERRATADFFQRRQQRRRRRRRTNCLTVLVTLTVWIDAEKFLAQRSRDTRNIRYKRSYLNKKKNKILSSVIKI